MPEPFFEYERITSLRSWDVVRTSPMEKLRFCPHCNSLMKIQIEFGENGRDLVNINCVENCYLRENGNEFRIWERRWSYKPFGTSQYIYCKGCRRRVAWRLFKTEEELRKGA